MASKINPVVPIDIGGKSRHLKLDLNAMVTFEEVTGKSFLSGVSKENFGAREFRALLYSCMRHEEKELTLEQVGEWITMENMDSIASAINGALVAAMPEAKKETAPLAGKPLAGSKSGR